MADTPWERPIEDIIGWCFEYSAEIHEAAALCRMYKAAGNDYEMCVAFADVILWIKRLFMLMYIAYQSIGSDPRWFEAWFEELIRRW